jgi:pimeloyl-ACP methyl ester carboxylesterase
MTPLVRASALLAILLSFWLPTQAQQPAPARGDAMPALRPYEGPSRKGVDASTLTGKVLCGYQGWFTTPGDGSDRGWRHYAGRRQFRPGSCGIDLWPDVSELDEDERIATPFRHQDGRAAAVFSSHNPKTVLRHFRWMEQYGIDGVFVQRFAVETIEPKDVRHCNTILAHCREGANRSGRCYAVMYDLSGLPSGGTRRVIEDWKLLVDRMKIGKDPKDAAYLRHLGKPVVAVWGIGFNDGRKYSLEECEKLVEFLKNDRDYGGCTVLLGVPTGWRTLDRDSVTDAALHRIIAKADVISPWTVGRYRSLPEVADHARQRWGRDEKWCKDQGKEYLPVVFPGFSWHNSHRRSVLDEIPRQKGRFLWKQFGEAKKAGATMIYVAMFDEMDEGTAIFKCTNDPPVGASRFVTLEGLPSDHYLRLTGMGGKLLRGEIAAREELPPREKVAEPPTTFTGEKTTWHGFDRYDFLMDQESFTIKPIKATADEGSGIRTQVKGQLRCIVVVPKKAAAGKPWSWRGYYFDHEPQAEVELLKRGFHIGYIQSDAGKQWEAWYTFLTEKHGLSSKPAFVGMSRGGRNAFTWATTHPDKVSCIYADNPAVSADSISKLGVLAQHDVPLLHVCGSLDPILGKHTLVVEKIYQQLGGRVSVMIKEGAAHHPHSLRDPTPIADFIVRSLQPAGGAPPAFAGKRFTKSAYYGVENSYRDFPKEGTYITCRGPWFTGSYDRYEFRLDGIRGAVTVIAPRTAAPGKPWVFRADFVGRDAVVDLALLAKGFHVVTGPVPTDTNGPVLSQWNAVYKYLIDHGFSKKPVLEGAGGAAGEAYAWAVANPDKVSCIYGENPVLRSHMSKKQPIDNLAVLAKAGVPLLHVCGSLDPWLAGQTRVVEKRYRELGGKITVILQEGEGHYPLASKNRQPIVEFITKNAN